MKKWFYLIFLSGLLSCSIYNASEITPEKYMSWYSQNIALLSDTVNVRNIQFILYEKPIEVELSRFLLNDLMNSSDAKQSLADVHSRNELSFELKIKLPTSTSDVFDYNKKEGESNRMKKLSTQFNEYVKIITKDNDTVQCTRSNFIQGISNAPVASLQFSFELIERRKLKKMIIKDNFWSDEMLNFNLEKFTITRIPELKIKK